MVNTLGSGYKAQNILQCQCQCSLDRLVQTEGDTRMSSQFFHNKNANPYQEEHAMLNKPL